MLPESKLTDISNSSGQRFVIHKHRHKDLVLLQPAGKLYANKKSCDNTASHSPDPPAFGDLQEKPLSICCQNIKSSRGTASTVCNSSSVSAPLVVCSTLRSPGLFWGLCHLTHPTCTFTDHRKGALLLKVKFWVENSVCVVFRISFCCMGFQKCVGTRGWTRVKWGKRIGLYLICRPCCWLRHAGFCPGPRGVDGLTYSLENK